MEIEKITLTPKLAEELLLQNTHNRPIRDGYVELLASEIQAGRWRDYTGDTIRISRDKIMLDGQHRTLAVILAKKAIKTHIIRGIDPEAMDVIDTGMRRQAQDALHLSGVKYAAIVSAVIKYFIANGNGAGMAHADTFATNRKIKDVYDNDPIFWDNVASSAFKWYANFKVISPKMFGGCFAMALKNSKNPIKVAPFFASLSSGDGDEIVLKLRKILINNSMAARKYSSGAKRDMIQSHFNGYVKAQKYPYEHPERKWL